MVFRRRKSQFRSTKKKVRKKVETIQQKSRKRRSSRDTSRTNASTLESIRRRRTGDVLGEFE